MTIKRIVNGVETEFELTDYEMRQAYYEQEHICDVEDIKSYFEDFTDEDFECNYGMTRQEVESKYDAIAYRMRKYLGDDDSWTYSRDAAIEYIL